MWKTILLGVLIGGIAPVSATAQDKAGDLAIIANKNSALDNVSSDELTKIFRAEKTKDSAGVRLIVTSREAGSPERAAALSGIYKMSEDEYSKYFLQATFTGLVQSPPRQLSSAAIAKSFVASAPGGLSYVRASEADDSVKILTVDGHAPGDPAYPLKIK